MRIRYFLYTVVVTLALAALSSSCKGGSSGNFCDAFCGNGMCEEVSCFGEGCPCREFEGSCPEDCPPPPPIETVIPNPDPDPDPAELCVDNCGDGVCGEIVCQAVGCPCPETAASCPADCQAS